MIYCETSNKLLRDEQQATLAKSLYLRDETPILRKSLLVFYYYYKEKKTKTIIFFDNGFQVSKSLLNLYIFPFWLSFLIKEKRKNKRV